MMEWPGRCSRCRKPIDSWTDAGFDDKSWVHKACFLETQKEAQARGRELPVLRAPDERYHQLELPMLVFVLMFHFGLGLAVIGWIVIDQGGSQTWGAVLMALGIIIPALGLMGAAFNIISRRRIEQIHQELLLAGGWKPGR
jgi:hypothetical protein